MSTFCQTYVAIVDADASSCRALSRLLSAEGIQSVIYPSAEDFLGDTKQPRFDCLLLDVRLGGLSGIELHQRLKASGSSIPVIYLTADDEPQARQQAEAAGCVAYFRKTAPGREVIRSIRNAIHPDRDPSPKSL